MTIPRYVGLYDKGFNIAILNMFKDLKEKGEKRMTIWGLHTEINTLEK